MGESEREPISNVHMRVYLFLRKVGSVHCISKLLFSLSLCHLILAVTVVPHPA